MTNLLLTIDEVEKEYNIPTDWSSVTIEEFIELYSYSFDELNALEKAIRIVSIFTKISEEDIYMMSQEQFTQISDLLSFVNTEMVPETKDIIILNGENYYLKQDFSKLNLGEIVSLELLSEKTNGNLVKGMDELLCIFLRKKKDNGELESFKNSMMSRAELFKTVKVVDVFAIFSNFQNGNPL